MNFDSGEARTCLCEVRGTRKAALVSVRAAGEEGRLVSSLAEYTCRRLAKVKCSSVSFFCINFVTHAITKLRLFREQRVFCINGHICCLSMCTLQKDHAMEIVHEEICIR